MQTETMQAARLYGPHDVRIEPVPIPTPAAGELLVRVTRCGICPSDVRAYEGVFRSRPDYPTVTGHEWTGHVVTVGAKGGAVQVGQRVVVDWHSPCGSCHYCRRGYPNYCENLGRSQGGFAEYCLGRADKARIVPDSVGDDEACFCEPVACCLNGIESLHLRPGDDALIIGCGPIGLIQVQLARAQGARVIALDLLPERLRLASELGAAHTVPAAEVDSAGAVRELTAGRGAIGVMVTVGDPKLVGQAVEMAAPTGVVNLFAGFYPNGEAQFDFNAIHYRQITLTGSHNFLPRHFDAALHAIQHGTVQVRPLVSQILPLADIQRGLDTVSRLEGLKVLIAPEQEAGSGA
jgi:L-iditol 2-dehydrogenase